MAADGVLLPDQGCPGAETREDSRSEGAVWPASATSHLRLFRFFLGLVLARMLTTIGTYRFPPASA